ncbi:MAG: hypothetical protein NW224_15855 [Leptolyngbyaceae cyanobacterium bins.302]|nr:hypothetical protein [Leptolyngbyaceae cyanobacterium bins.302]
MPIYGPSGSGKSSLARAGLIPDLARHPIPGYNQARVAVLVPGTHPLESLGTVLARIATQDLTPVAKTREFARELKQVNEAGEYDGLRRIASVIPDITISPLVVLVDQFEEVYTLCKDSTEREAFVGNLLNAAGDRAKQVTVILTLRSDFLGEIQKHPDLNRLFSEQGYLVPAMNLEELRQVIAKPAELAGYPLDEATITLLLEQTKNREGALPLLQFTLSRIWEELRQGIPPVETLARIGGVGGALAGEAERVYASLVPGDKTIARRVFLGLVQLGEGTKDTRRRVSVMNLVSHQDDFEQVKQVIDRFAEPGVRLITRSASLEDGKETVEVTHEALIEHWQVLNQWLTQSRDDLRFQRRLEDAAQHWQAVGQPEGSLWRPPDLDLLKSFYGRVGEELTPLQLAFFQASISAVEAVEKQKKKQRRRVVLMLSGGVVILSAFSLTMAGLARFAFTKANETNLREQAARVLNWLPTAKSTQGLMLAIDTVNRSQDLAPNIFNTAQSSLLTAIQIAKEENLYQGHKALVPVDRSIESIDE